MPDSDIDLIVSVVDGILSDITKQPQLKPCVLPDGWIPIASLLNYTHLGRSVWPFGGVGVVADCLAARNSSVSELSGDNSCVRNKPMRVRLRHSLEFIFSDSNFHKDVHLQLLQEADGFTPLHLILSTYSQLQQLLQHVAPLPGVDPKAHQAAVVAEALDSSSELVLRPPQPDVAPFGAARRKTLPERVVQQARRPPPTARTQPPARPRAPHTLPPRPALAALDLYTPTRTCAAMQVEWYLAANKLATDRFLAEVTPRTPPRNPSSPPPWRAPSRSSPRLPSLPPPAPAPTFHPAWPPSPLSTHTHLPLCRRRRITTDGSPSGPCSPSLACASYATRRRIHMPPSTPSTHRPLAPSHPLAPPRTTSHPLAPPRTPLHPLAPPSRLGRWRRWLTCSHDLRSSRYPRTRLA